MTVEDGKSAPAGDIVWQDGDVPFSPQFGDIYYNPKDGLAETRYVFLKGNNLPDAWQGQHNFTIGETGFGTGLNFLAAWQSWKDDPGRSARLHFVSVEKYPLTREDLARAHKAWPELSDLSTELCHAWPRQSMLPGIHRFILGDGAVSLTVMVGDAIACWSGYQGCVDCWFLDGFAPSRNPDMWDPALFQALGAASNPNGASLATFTAARIARDGLEGAGFDISKRKGFGYKRDMITAVLPETEPAQDVNPATYHITDDPWFNLPRSQQSNGKTVAVIGGGMAGAACAAALKKRGCTVTLFEKSNALASAASGNPIGMLEPYFTVDAAITGRFYEAGFRFSHQMIHEMAKNELVEADFCGVLDLANSPRKQEKLDGLIRRLGDKPDLVQPMNANQASETVGVPFSAGGVFYPMAGWVNPPSFVHALCSGISVEYATEITEITTDTSGKTLVSHDGRTFGPFDSVIIAGARETANLAQTSWLGDHLHPVRGQISYLPEAQVKAAYSNASIHCVLSHKGYLTPARNGQLVFGATFGRGDDGVDIREDDHAFNIGQLGKVLPDLAEALSASELDGRASLRTTTADHLPLIGPAPDYDAFLTAYGDIDKGKKNARYVGAPYHKDVYICTGFGARGLIAAPLAAEILASEICAMPLPLEKSLMDAVHPGRFIVRGLKRRQIEI